MKILALIVILLTLSCGGQTGRTEDLDVEYLDEAERLAREIIVLDTHIDVPYRLSKKEEDISERTVSGDFDYVRARQGGLNCAFMSIYVPSSIEPGSAKPFADRLIDQISDFEQRWPRKFAVAYSPGEITAQFGRDLVSLPMGLENGSALENDLGNIAYFHERGIRYITLTHAKANQISDSSYDPDRIWGGLSPFGREVIREMNRVGIMVDVSHITDEAFFQVLELSRAPVIASHSSCRHFTPGWERNMSDEMIRALSEKGGVIQINFGSMFLNEEYQAANSRIWEYLQKKGLDEDSEEAVAIIRELKGKYPHPVVTVPEIVAHINHVTRLVGIDHVGLGSDFDGVGDNLPVGMEDVSKYPNLIRELLRNGYSRQDIEKICGANLLRVWRQVEEIAADR